MVEAPVGANPPHAAGRLHTLRRRNPCVGTPWVQDFASLPGVRLGRQKHAPVIFSYILDLRYQMTDSLISKSSSSCQGIYCCLPKVSSQTLLLGRAAIFSSRLSSARTSLDHAASFSKPYSWWSAPRIGRATKRTLRGSRWPVIGGAGSLAGLRKAGRDSREGARVVVHFPRAQKLAEMLLAE